MYTSPDPPIPPTELTAGAHLSPQDGACLMEWVSVLALEPWSDSPATTHPLIAHLARLVNDLLSSQARPELMSFAPRLARCTNADPTLHAQLAALVTGKALQVNPGFIVSWMHTTAHRQEELPSRPAPHRRISRVILAVRLAAYRRGPAFRAIEAGVRALCDVADSDRHLVECLERAISLVEATGAASDVPLKGRST